MRQRKAAAPPTGAEGAGSTGRRGRRGGGVDGGVFQELVFDFEICNIFLAENNK